MNRQLATILLDDEAYDHLPAAVELHRAQLSEGFLTSLGDRFLLEVFRNIACSSHGVALIARPTCVGTEGAQTISGFLFGTTNAKALYRDFILQRGARASLFAAPRLLRPRALRKFWETLCYPKTRRRIDAPDAELLDLAVSQAAKGTGLAQALFRAFVHELERRGHNSFRVTTGKSLTRAHRFYEKQGAVRQGEIEIHQDEATVVFIYGPHPGGS